MGALKRSGGRPTLYKPEFCERTVVWMAKGYSISGLAGHLGVARNTIDLWGANHPEFAAALNLGRVKSAEYWEGRARDLASGGQGNAAVVIFALKNRVAIDWRERVEHTGADGGPIRYELSGLSDNELAELERIVGKIAPEAPADDRGDTLRAGTPPQGRA